MSYSVKSNAERACYFAAELGRYLALDLLQVVLVVVDLEVVNHFYEVCVF